MDIFIVIIVNALIAWLCVEMAKTRNRDALTWGILGFLFGIIAVIILALIGKKEA